MIVWWTLWCIWWWYDCSLKKAHQIKLTLQQPAMWVVWRIWWWYDFSLKNALQARAAETSTPERGDQEPGTTMQTRAAASGNNIKNSICYGNTNETDKDASWHNVYIYVYICIYIYTYICMCYVEIFIIHTYNISFMMMWCIPWCDVYDGDMIVVSKRHNNTSSRCGSRRCGWCMCVCMYVCVCVYERQRERERERERER